MSRLKLIGSAYASMIAHNLAEDRARREREAREERAMAAVESRIVLDALARELTPEKIEALMMHDRGIIRMTQYRIPLPEGIDEIFSLANHEHTFGSYGGESDFKKLCQTCSARGLLAILEEMNDNDFSFYIDKDSEGNRSFLFWYHGH